MSTMTKEKLSVEKILEKLDKGERIGIDEGIFFLRQAKKLLGKSELERFFSAAKAQAKKNPPPAPLRIERWQYDANNIPEPTAPIVFLQVENALSLNDVLQAIRAVAAKAKVAALAPTDVLRLATNEKLKVLTVAQQLAEAGLSYTEGKFDAKADDILAMDEQFSVVMMLQRFGIKASAWLPLSFEDEEKVRHLARLREFHDRTQAFDFLFLFCTNKTSQKDLLLTTALARLMLDNLKRIALATYSENQTKMLPEEVLQECIALGVNQV